MARVGCQDKVAEACSQCKISQSGKIVVAPDIRVHQEEGIRAEERARLRDAARGVERFGLARVGDAQAEARTVAERARDLLAEVGKVDHRLAAAARRQALEEPDDQRLAARLDQRLGQRIGERPQPLAAARGEEHGFHSSSSRSRASGASAA